MSLRIRSMGQHWTEIALVGFLYACYDATRGLASGSVAQATRNANRIVRGERDWGVHPEVVLNHALSRVPVLEVASSYFYATLHFVVTPLVLVWMYRRHGEHYRRARTVVALATFGALIGFWLYPTMPPRLVSGLGINDTLADVHQWGWWSGNTSAPAGLGGLANEFAAMPSLHIIWATWAGYLIARHARRRWVRVVGTAYPIATALVVIATGNHYLLDVLAGLLVLGMATAVAALTFRDATLRRPEPAAPTGLDGIQS